LLCLAALALAVAAVIPAAGAAATFTVNTTADQAPFSGQCSGAPGDCSLRQAIGAANSLGGADTIVLPAGHYALTLKGGEEDLNASGDLDVAEGSAIAIQGAGARTTTIDATGLGERAIDVLPQASLNLTRLTVTGGEAIDVGGGGILAEKATLGLDQVAVTGNTSSEAGYGGGIDVLESTVTITNSLLARNRDSGDGGAIYADKTALTIVNTTLANNVVDTALFPGTPVWGAYGGAAEISHGSLTLQNVTIAGNSIRDGNGGTEGYGAGLAAFGDTTNIVNTIVAGNTASEVGVPAQCKEPLPSAGHNLESPQATGLPRCFESPTDLIADPLLGPLANNGGETDTMALLLGSPAIDAGDPARCPTTDQRGVARPQLHGCDIGAFEYVPPPPTIARKGKVKVKRSGKGFLVKTGFVVSCPAGTEACGGKIDARWKKGAIGKKRFTVAPGARARLSLKLNHRGAKLLRERGKLRARFEVLCRTASSAQAKATASLKLRLPQTRRRR
jgi:CSLREA domain-containing protein